MEKSKRVLTLIAIVAAVTISSVALALNGNFFTFTKDFTDIIGIDRRFQAPSPFLISKLPEFFSSSVVVEGSGYTGQPHTVDITISHSRPDSSIWLASGDYSLDLEITERESEEQITSGSFSDLRKGTPYVAPQQPWSPSSLEGSYEMVLSLNDIQWTMLPEYIITATVGSAGGTIVSGPTIVVYWTPEEFKVLQGDSQGFNIIPDAGYSIFDVLVDDSSVGPVDIYAFIDVHATHTITADFAVLGYTYSSTRISLTGPDITLTGASFDGSDPTTYSAGDTVSFVLYAVWDTAGTNGDLDSLTYAVKVNLVGETRTTVIPSVYKVYTPVISTPGGPFQITGSFTQPTDTGGPWEIQIVVIARTTNP